MKKMPKIKLLAALTMALTGTQLYAFPVAFPIGDASVAGSFDTTITVGTGIRLKNQSCGLILKDTTGTAPGGAQPGGGGPSGCAEYVSGLGDQGNLNYNKGDAFTTYLKGVSELLLKFPENIKFMGRVSWLKDFSATDITGYTSVANPPGVGGLTAAASDQLSFKARLLDFWVSKDMEVGDQNVRVRVGNQVISWGESLFIPGGINQTNAVDYMRLSQPGTQLKEVFLPAPIISVASGLGYGLNMETYVQTAWNADYFPPTGSYWSVVNGLGAGSSNYGLSNNGKSGAQYGAALRWQPDGTQVNLGLYAMSYTDKAPNLSYNAQNSGQAGWVYLEDRKMFGISGNVPVGDWAVGSELSYRPKDAVSLNPGAGCSGNGGNCYIDEKKFQWHLTGILSMTPSDAYGDILNLLGGAQTGTLLAEAVVVKYPGLKSSYNGVPVSAGAWNAGLLTNPSAALESVGTATSSGFNFDFSWVYDGTLLSGWQVQPELYYFRAVKGRTPNLMATFMEGAQSANLILTFTQNPATWQMGVNYGKFWGGSTAFDQPLADRDYFGAYVSRNF